MHYMKRRRQFGELAEESLASKAVVSALRLSNSSAGVVESLRVA